MDGGRGGCGCGMPKDWVDGRRAFAAELEGFLEGKSVGQLTQVNAQLMRPIRIAVDGRPGVGRRTVARALSARGVSVVDAGAEVRVLVIAETLKPEDRAELAASDLPVLIVANKADVCALAPGFCAPAPATDVVPMNGLLCTLTTLDDDVVAALRTFVAVPPDLSSVDAFVTTAHPVERGLRARLLDLLDRFGVGLAVEALATGADPAAALELLHRRSNVDAVLARLNAVAAPARYRRVQSALADLRALAASTDDERLWQFLAADATVAAQLPVALDVLEAAGWAVADVEQSLEPARRALHWDRQARGPLAALPRACAADAVRGALRLLDQGQGRA